MKQNRKRSKYLLAMLSAYIILQFLWWGYMLVVNNPHKATMVIGEGSVFLLILIYGIWRYQLSMRLELSLHQRQSNFLLSVTHELKTPISSVQLILQTILKHDLDEQQVKSFLDKALIENKKSETLIQNMLHASNLEHNRMALVINEVNIDEFSSTLLELLSNRYENKISIVNLSAFKCLRADKYMLESVIIQLVDNSFKYGAQSVSISFNAGVKVTEITIADDGPGISEEDRPFIFDKFFRSGDDNKREQGGTGLGLYLAKEFIDLHNGTLSHAHQLPKGAIFNIKLPK